MYKLLILLLSINFSTGNDLPQNTDIDKLIFSDVIYTDNNISSDEMLIIARQWYSKLFDTPPFFYQTDSNGNILTGKGKIFTGSSGRNLYAGIVEFSLELQFKDGKYKYIVSNLIHTAFEPEYSGGDLDDNKPDCGTLNISKRQWKKIKDSSENKVMDLINNLKDHINKGTIMNNNW